MISPAPRLCLIAALGSNRVIGAEGSLPWRLRTDLRRFKALTHGKPVLMGRKTWDSIGKPLPNRANLVLSREAGFGAPGGWVLSSLPAALAFARAIAAKTQADEIYVIGGQMLYAQTLALADRLYLTHVAASPSGNAFFPQFDEGDFQECQREDIPAGPGDEHASVFRALDRRR